jgi:hypothetical protein
MLWDVSDTFGGDGADALSHLPGTNDVDRKIGDCWSHGSMR